MTWNVKNLSKKYDRVGVCLIAVYIACNGTMSIADDSLRVSELTELGFEDLFQIEVTSVSKKPESWFDASAAVYVLSQDDLRRSGARTVAEALRMVPGLNVAQLDANKWAVSARGFNGLYAHDLLVLVDGRSVYSPLHSGVHWDTIDPMIEDIDRIEVIRGPGATLWGANAVNGVINIITKDAALTRGTLVSTGVGDREGNLSVRYGGKTGKNINYRVYAQYTDVDNNARSKDDDREAADDWRMARAGFRMDWSQGPTDDYTLQGGFYSGILGETLSYPELSVPGSFRITEDRDMQVAGAHLLGGWMRRLHDNSDIRLQLYYDHSARDEEPFEEAHDTLDLDLQHTFQFTARNQIIWGGGFRYISDRTQPSFRYGFANDKRKTQQLNLFVQDEIAVSDTVSATAGVKFEHYDYTNWETQPNLRLAWSPSTDQTIWGAVSRAVRTPSRNDDDVIINTAAFPLGDGTPAVVRILGNPNLDSEHVTAYEVGYRVRPTLNSFADIAVFYNKYKRLLGTTSLPSFFESSPSPAHLVLPRQFENDSEGYTQGVELAATTQLRSDVKLSVWYAYLDMEITAPDGFDISGNSPKHQGHARLFWNVSEALSFDTAVYYVSDLNVRNRTQPVDDYVRTDFRVAWHNSARLEIAGGVRNAFDPHHAEYGSIPFVQAAEIGRTFYAQLVAKL